MLDDDETLELFNLLNLPAGAPVVQRHHRWARAFEAWLHARRTRYHRGTSHASHLAWREFLAFTGKPPWNVTVEDVDAYTASLEARGLSPSTIANRLAGLASFYAYCHEHRIDARLPPGFNPVQAARRPKRIYYVNVPYLSPEEEAALLQAARQDDWPISKRDYALLLALLRTGWKSLQVRTLTWGQLCGLQQGEDAANALPPDVWAAILDYLQAAGRLESIQPEHYLFAPTNQRLFSERWERAEDWDAGRPLSAIQLHYVLKQHARLAGLKAEAITCHTLRHTAAVRFLEGGQSLDAVGTRLDRKGKLNSRLYLRRLQKSRHGRLMARKRGIVKKSQALSRVPHRFQRHHHLGLTHGLWAKYLPEFETLAEQGVRLDPLDADVLRWRIVIKRATILWEHIETVVEASLVPKAMSQATANLVRAIKRRKKVRALAKEFGLQADLLEGWGEDL